MVDDVVYWVAILCVSIIVCMVIELIDSVRNYG